MAAKTTEEITAALKSLLKEIEEKSGRTDKSWNNIADNIKKVTSDMTRGWPGALASLTGSHKILGAISGTIVDAFSGSKTHLADMEKILEGLKSDYQKLEDPTRTPEKQAEAYRKAYSQYEKARVQLEAHKALHDQIAKTISTLESPAMAGVVAAFALTYRYSHLINQALMQASADWRTRLALSSQIANVQAETGNEMKDMAKAASALVKYGFDLRNNFRDTLSVVVKMEEGLGVSYETSAEMAVMMQRIGTNLRAVADGIARVKADTALSAEEATKFATEIAKAINLLKPGSGGMADQVIEYVNRLGGALRQVGGNAADIKDLLVGFTQYKGMMGAATLGATPDFLSDPNRAREVTKRFVDYVNKQLAGTSGYQRMATIQLLSEQFNTSADLIANADKMLEEYNNTVAHTTNLQDEWRMQTSELGKSISKIFNSLAGVVQQVLIPVFQVMRPVLAVVADWIQAFTKSLTGLLVVGGGLAVATTVLAYQFGKLAIQMYKAAVASEVYQSTLKGGGVASPLLRIVTAWLPRIGFILTRGLPIVGAALAGIAAGTYIQNKNIGGVNDKLQLMLRTQMASALEYRAQNMALRGQSYAAVMSGVSALVQRNASAGEIQKYLLKNASALIANTPGGSDPESVRRMASSLLGSVGDIITSQRAAVKYSGLTEQSEEDKRRQEVLIELFKAVALNTELQNKLMERAEKKNELVTERDRSFNEEVKRQADIDKAAQKMNLENPMRYAHF